MKKLLSLALVLTMLFTIISVPSVSAADAKGDYLIGDFKTVAKMGFETGDAEPKKAGSQSYNVFTTKNAVDKNGVSIETVSMKGAVMTYQDAGITAPVSLGETFGSNVVKFDFDAQGVGGYQFIRARMPFSIAETVQIQTGKLYRISVWVKVETLGTAGVTSGQVSLKFGDDINSNSSDWVTVNKGQWTKLNIDYVPTANHESSNMFILAMNGSNGAPTVFYVDNFRIEEFQDTKTGSQVVAYTAMDKSGTPYGTGTAATYTLKAGSAGSISDDLSATYDTNTNTTSFPYARELYEEGSPVYYPHMPQQIFKKTSTSRAWLVRLSNAFATSDIAEGDKVRISMDVYNTDAVAHAKLADGTMGAAADIETSTIQMYPTDGSSNGDVKDLYVKKDVPVDTWYRLEKIITIPSGWAATGVRVDGVASQGKEAAFNTPFASTTYFTNFKYEKITDTTAKVNVGVSSEVEGETVTGAGEYTVGGEVTVTATEVTTDNSKMFKGWYDGYVCVSTDASYTFTAVTPVNLVARYEANKIDVNLEITGDGDTVTATATVNDIKSGGTIDAIVIIAAYDADDNLVGVSFSENGVSKALAIDETISATYTKNASENVDKYVAFLWNDLTNIRPYVLPVSLPVSEVTE